jgi:predicted permease
MRLFPGSFTRRKQELDEELQAHLQMAAQDRQHLGESPEEARRATLREFGNVGLIKDVTRESWGWIHFERVFQDLKYALRQLVRSPGFAITVIATLALGLGATVAMFTVVDRVLLRPLPYEHPSQLVEIREAGKRGIVENGVPYLDLAQWRSQTHTLGETAFYISQRGKGHLSFLEGSAGAIQVGAPAISANLLPALGVSPVMGRGFAIDPTTGAAQSEDAHSILLSDPIWRGFFGADPAILGKTIQLSGNSWQVIGVMPRGFSFPETLAVPLVWTPVVLGDKDTRRIYNVSPTYSVIGRLKLDVRLADAQAELNVIQPQVARQYTDPYERDQVSSVHLQRYSDSLVDGSVKKSLFALFGASGVLWLIACVNVTGLLFARAAVRQREIAVRGALGASRLRILQQLLIEGLLLSATASILGFALAIVTLKLFEHTLTSQFHIATSMMPSLPVIAVLLALTLLSATLSSLWPALGSARASIEPALRQGGPQRGSGGVHYRIRALLVVAEVAMSLTLLVGCGLLLRTLYALHHVPLGFRTDHVLVANMTIPAYKFAGQDMTTTLYQPLLERVQHLPGVESAALMTEVPLGKTFQMIFSLRTEGNSTAEIRKRELRAQFRAVGPEMQQVFGFRMAYGRFFNQHDTPSSQPVAVVNRAFVRAYFGDDRDPREIFGESLFSFSKDKRALIVGVLDDARQVSIAEQAQPEIEVDIPQITPDAGFYKGAEGMAMDLAVRTGRSPSTIIPELRELMRRASPELVTANFTTMEQVVEDSYGSQQLAAHLLEIFGAAALLLCVSGIYGLLAYLVSQRTRELGLRIALGARRADIMSLILRQAAWMLLVGSSAGLGLAWLSSRLFQTFLYSVPVHDPWTMAAVTTILLVGGLSAASLPARRAANVDPMQALRAE